MKISQKIAVIIAGVFVVVVSLGALTVWAVNNAFDGLAGGCSGEIYSSAKTPDKKLVAYSFERDCGATTGFGSFIVLKSASEKFRVADDLVATNIVFSTDGKYLAKLKWLSNDKLLVDFSGGSAPSPNEIRQQSVVNDKIRIIYKGLRTASR